MKIALWKKSIDRRKLIQSVNFHSILEKITNELDKWFGDNSDLISGIRALNSESLKVLICHDTTLLFAQAYLGDIERLKSDLKMYWKIMNRYETKNNLKFKEIFFFYKFLKEYEIAFSETYKLCYIAITIPVWSCLYPSAAWENTFSFMKYVKSYLNSEIVY